MTALLDPDFDEPAAPSGLKYVLFRHVFRPEGVESWAIQPEKGVIRQVYILDGLLVYRAPPHPGSPDFVVFALDGQPIEAVSAAEFTQKARLYT